MGYTVSIPHRYDTTEASIKIIFDDETCQFLIGMIRLE